MNDVAAAGEFLFSEAEVFTDELFQVVDVVEVNIGEVLDGGVDVAWDGDVD